MSYTLTLQKLAYNPEKCEVIRITKKNKPIIFVYKLYNIKLKATKNAKYLGLLISDDYYMD